MAEPGTIKTPVSTRFGLRDVTPGQGSPRLSILIPTYNRAALLDVCLGRLPLFECEIIVSDNASEDDTASVAAKHMKYDRRIRYIGLPENRGPLANWRHALEGSTGELVVCLADDDALLGDPLQAVCGLFQRDPSLVGCYCDHACWNDAESVELHRYGFPVSPVEVAEGPPLVEFLLREEIPPEIGVFRREAWLAAMTPVSRAMPFHVWCYNLSRLGKVRFDPTVYYRENWVLKPGLARTYWANQTLFNYAGDEQRLGLESMVRLCERDTGQTWPRPYIRDMIDYGLLKRTTLEIQRACARGDHVLACELRRRQQLWGWSVPFEQDQALAADAAEATGFSVEAFRI